MLFRLYLHRTTSALLTVAALAAVAIGGILACESGPTQEFSDTTGRTFVAFCPNSLESCHDVQVTGDVACDPDAYLSTGSRFISVCLDAQCRPVVCERDDDCTIGYGADSPYACNEKGLCATDAFNWRPSEVDAYCLRTQPRDEVCKDYGAPFVTSPYAANGDCPFPAGDLRCVAYDVCSGAETGYVDSCNAPTVCD
jgi:hypothetical protein